MNIPILMFAIGVIVGSILTCFTMDTISEFKKGREILRKTKEPIYNSDGTECKGGMMNP